MRVKRILAWSCWNPILGHARCENFRSGLRHHSGPLDQALVHSQSPRRTCQVQALQGDGRLALGAKGVPVRRYPRRSAPSATPTPVIKRQRHCQARHCQSGKITELHQVRGLETVAFVTGGRNTGSRWCHHPPRAPPRRFRHCSHQVDAMWSNTFATRLTNVFRHW